MATTVSNILSAAVNAINKPNTLVFFEYREDVNKATQAITESVPMICIDANFKGAFVPTAGAKIYQSFDLGILFCGLPNSDSDASAQATIAALQELAYEFINRVRQRAEWQAVPSNSYTTLAPKFQILSEQFDTRLIVLALYMGATFDLSLPNYCPA